MNVHTMAEFDDFQRMCSTVEAMLDNASTPVRWVRHPYTKIACMYGCDVSPLQRAQHGLEHIEEMGYTAAEHHPYYRLLNGIAEATRILLDRWDGTITPEEVDQMRWSLSNVDDALDRMQAD